MIHADNPTQTVISTAIKSINTFTFKTAISISTIGIVVTIMDTNFGTLVYIFTNNTISGISNPTLAIIIAIDINTVSEF